MTTIRQGNKNTCYLYAPNVGDFDADFGGYVMEVSVQPTGEEEIARLTYSSEFRNGFQLQEVDWQPIQKSLAEHPRYNSGGAKALSSDDIKAIAAWEAGRRTFDTGLTNWYDYRKFDANGQSAGVGSLSANAQDYATKIAAGTDSYVVDGPIARRITNNWLILSVGSNLGSVSGSAPFAACPSGYKWRKCTDRARRDGAFWERTEEWQGADSWDNDLYS